MAAGTKRHKLTLQTRTEALDAYGEATLTYATLAEAWARLSVVSAAEREDARGTEAEVTHKAIVRYASSYASLTPADRVTYGSRTFDIIDVFDPDGRSRELHMRLKERL